MEPGPAPGGPRPGFLWLALLVSLPVFLHGLSALRSPPLSVLCFHAVGETPPDPWTVDRARFEAMLAAVAGTGLPVVGPDALATGGPGVLLSFDDGRRSHLETVAPRLSARGWKGLFFLITGEGQGALTPPDLATLVAGGHILGAHSRTHRSLLRAPGEPEDAYATRLGDEVGGSRKDLEAILGRPVELYAYPLGDFDASARAEVARAGLTAAFTVDFGHFTLGDDPLLVPRYLVTSTTTPEAIRDFLTTPARNATLELVVSGLLAAAAVLGLARRAGAGGIPVAA